MSQNAAPTGFFQKIKDGIAFLSNRYTPNAPLVIDAAKKAPGAILNGTVAVAGATLKGTATAVGATVLGADALARADVGKMASSAAHMGADAVSTGASVAKSGVKSFAKGSFAVGKFAGKGLLVGGVAAAGLFTLASLLSSPKRPRRMDAVNETMGMEPIVFNPGANVGVGSLAVPQIGQQAQMGNFAQQVQQGAPEMGAQFTAR